jgi:hypothetical protein
LVLEKLSAGTAQLLHGLLFSDGRTIDNIPFARNVYFKGDIELISVRDWDEEKFQITHEVSSARYPPKLHLPEIKSGIKGVLGKLQKSNDKYKIIRTVPKARQLVFPERYEFSHDVEWYETLKGYVSRGRTKISDWYFCNEKWNMGDTFHNGYTLPEDVGFLTRFLAALEKL